MPGPDRELGERDIVPVPLLIGCSADRVFIRKTGGHVEMAEMQGVANRKRNAGVR